MSIGDSIKIIVQKKVVLDNKEKEQHVASIYGKSHLDHTVKEFDVLTCRGANQMLGHLLNLLGHTLSPTTIQQQEELDTAQKPD